MNTLIQLLLVSTILVSFSSACPGLFGMGGGGGCGCGAPPPPPPPSCGCGGRKKRSLPDKQPKIEFTGIVSNTQDVLCNTPELKHILIKNMGVSESESAKSIQSVLESKQLNNYIVVCSKEHFTYAMRIDIAYCGAQTNDHYCHIFAK